MGSRRRLYFNFESEHTQEPPRTPYGRSGMNSLDHISIVYFIMNILNPLNFRQSSKFQNVPAVTIDSPFNVFN